MFYRDGVFEGAFRTSTDHITRMHLQGRREAVCLVPTWPHGDLDGSRQY
jgi:hypothetical protein